MSRIPKLIHQTWKSYDLPEKYITLVDSWKKMHPDWKYKLYDDQDCIEFIQSTKADCHQAIRHENRSDSR